MISDNGLLFVGQPVYKYYTTLDIPVLHNYQLCLLVHRPKLLFCNKTLPFVLKNILHKTVQFISITQNEVMIYICNDVTLHWVKD